MRTFLKYLGIFIVLAGVLVLALPFFWGLHTNRSLTIGILLVIAGFIYYIISNKYL